MNNRLTASNQFVIAQGNEEGRFLEGQITLQVFLPPTDGAPGGHVGLQITRPGLIGVTWQLIKFGNGFDTVRNEVALDCILFPL